MIIETQALRKEYDDLIAVNSVNLQIPEGEIYALIGPNGAGKTTLMKMICGLLEPTSGKILVNGVDVWEQNIDANAYMAFLPDFFNLYDNLTVWEYLDYFCHAYKLEESSIEERINRVLSLVGLTDKRDSLTKTLSRGMQQRLGIGKSILHGPRLLVLDEPAAGLDPIARQELSKLLVLLKQNGVTILISSHILSELADFSSMVGIMEQGRLVKSGSIKSLVAQENASQLVTVSYTGDGQKLKAALSKIKEVSNIKALADKKFEFEYDGDDDEMTDLLKNLVAKNVGVMGFSKKERGIQDIFARVTQEEKKK